MKNIKKMVSVILGVVISCMCFVTPVCAVNEAGASIKTSFVTPVCAVNEAEASVTATNVGNYGIVQVRAYPVIFNTDTEEIEAIFTPPAQTERYSGGAFLVNLTIPDMLKGIYNANNCNYWLYEIDLASSSGVTSIVANINNGMLRETLPSTAAGTYSLLVPGTEKFDYLTYEFIWYWSGGTNFVSGGHISRK